jgi:hypothetical protein
MEGGSMKITAIARPFVYVNGQHEFLLTSQEAQRMIDGGSLLAYNVHRVQFCGGGILRPATLDGGPAFIIEHPCCTGGR